MADPSGDFNVDPRIAGMEDGRLLVHREKVAPAWIDYNGHMNVAYYVLAFDHAADGLFDKIGFDQAFRSRHQVSTFAVEAHVSYIQELKEGDPMRFEVQILDLSDKALHYICLLYHDGEDYLAATAEWVSLSMNMATRRVGAFHPETKAALTHLFDQHKGLPRPRQAGRSVGIRRSSVDKTG